MKNRTIIEAILEVFRIEGKPLLTKDIYNKIIEHDLYRFRAQKPEDFVQIQFRRHCAELDFPIASSIKLFLLIRMVSFLNWRKNQDNPKFKKRKMQQLLMI